MSLEAPLPPLVSSTGTHEDTMTTLPDLIATSWAQHADDPAGVWQRLPAALDLVDAPTQLPQLAALALHVGAEHLGRNAPTLTFLDQLLQHPACEPQGPSGQAVLRAKASLLLVTGDDDAFAECLERGHPGCDTPLASTQIRVLAVAATTLAGQGRLTDALAQFHRALALADQGLRPDDPAARTLAITANNLACELEELPERSHDHDTLLRLAATTARRFWEVAGDGSNVMLAEYRLCKTHLALREPDAALTHARHAVALCDTHDLSPDLRLFAHEALALAHHAANDTANAHHARHTAHTLLDQLPPSERAYAQATLDDLDRLLS